MQEDIKMIRLSFIERLAKLPEDQRNLVLEVRKYCGCQSSHRILDEYEQKNDRGKTQNTTTRNNS